MARRSRSCAGGLIYHVLNRGNCRMTIFSKPGDYRAFLKLIEEGRQRTGMRILGFCLMPNHWHMVLWPVEDGDLSRFLGWVCTTHVRRWREHREKVGEGHLYQGRFKDFPVADDIHLLTVLRYVEANPLRAGLVRRAEDWPWSSLAFTSGNGEMRVEVADWPLSKPRNWVERVNEVMQTPELERLRTSAKRGRPFGDDSWVERTVKRLGLQSTVRDPWRPRKGIDAGKTRRRHHASSIISP